MNKIFDDFSGKIKYVFNRRTNKCLDQPSDLTTNGIKCLKFFIQIFWFFIDIISSYRVTVLGLYYSTKENEHAQ